MDPTALALVPFRPTEARVPLKFYFTHSPGMAIPAMLCPWYNLDTMTHHAPVENELDDDESCGVCNGLFEETSLSTFCTNEKHGFANMHLACLNAVDEDTYATQCPLCSWTLCLDVHQNDINVSDVDAILWSWHRSARCAWISVCME